MNKKQLLIGFIIVSVIAGGVVYFVLTKPDNENQQTDKVKSTPDTTNESKDPETNEENKPVDQKNVEPTTDSVATTVKQKTLPSQAPTASETNVVPEYTTERRNGRPLEDFPFTIMTDPPHSFHTPVTDFASFTNTSGNYTFTLPIITNDLGLYGQFWLSPVPPTPDALLVGVRLKNATWTGTQDNSIVVFSLLDRQTENNALGIVAGATQGLAGELVAVLFAPSAEEIEMRFYSPVASSGERFVFAVDSENLPTGNPTIYPDTIGIEQVQWLWQAP